MKYIQTFLFLIVGMFSDVVYGLDSSALNTQQYIKEQLRKRRTKEVIAALSDTIYDNRVHKEGSKLNEADAYLINLDTIVRYNDEESDAIVAAFEPCYRKQVFALHNYLDGKDSSEQEMLKNLQECIQKNLEIIAQKKKSDAEQIEKLVVDLERGKGQLFR